MKRRNQGRRYEADEWAMFMLEGWLDYEKETVKHGEYDFDVAYADVEDIDVYDVEWTPDLTKAVADYEQDVEKAVAAFAKKHPLVEDVDVDDIMTQGAPGDVYLALDGSGAGDINYGEWNRFFVEDLDDDKLISFLKKRLGKYVDDSGAGKIPEAMNHSVYLAFKEKFDELDDFDGSEYTARPEEDDFVVEQKGDRWFVYRIGLGPNPGYFDTQKKMEKALVAEMKREGHYPNVWWSYERGDPRDLYEFEHVEKNPKKTPRKAKKKAAKRGKKKAAKRRAKKTTRRTVKSTTTTTVVTNPERARIKRRCMR